MKLFTADTHFGQKRALELSRRPFKTVEDMDSRMLFNINQAILKAKEPVELIHLGDFGNHEMVRSIKCPVTLLMGNYERKEVEDKQLSLREYSRFLQDMYGYVSVIPATSFRLTINNGEIPLACVHEPTNAKGLIKDKESRIETVDPAHVLFGHIHGRQKIKKMGMDVGVDANNYRPFTEADIMFYLNAIDKFYDEEVFFDMN